MMTIDGRRLERRYREVDGMEVPWHFRGARHIHKSDYKKFLKRDSKNGKTKIDMNALGECEKEMDVMIERVRNFIELLKTNKRHVWWKWLHVTFPRDEGAVVSEEEKQRMDKKLEKIKAKIKKSEAILADLCARGTDLQVARGKVIEWGM